MQSKDIRRIGFIGILIIVAVVAGRLGFVHSRDAATNTVQAGKALGTVSAVAGAAGAVASAAGAGSAAGATVGMHADAAGGGAAHGVTQ